MMINLTERDEGKRVVDTEGERIGEIAEFDRGVAYVDPDEQLPEWVQQETRRDEGDYVLKNSMVHSVTEEEIRVHR